ncbi:uroporphyrinogen-III C-methyltransferase [Herbiconiux ginsengi]|uniref:uroporphyrinogen-III C-methyltransferase n=1 Tax=Herbiconiux ginsengi TaxID=381665 RepID=A0A1H3JG43_9MICO|nr:uroporphyrinogen-III C-methyltransferase [Herbiconiux ginsengi]SDY38906.1 uroporphyrin-III C-methyltransferase [Herbiconiux ginsengi]
MHVPLELAGRRVVVFGSAGGARRILARYGADGAVTRLAEPVTALDAASQIGDAEFVVWAHPSDTSVSTRDSVREAAAERRLWFVTETPLDPTPLGHVALVGGGPGDPGLITVAGRRMLAEADVVLYDRLAPRDLLEEWAPGAELIDVGKTPGHHAVPQREIERLLVEWAQQGLRVVRLKGGDSFVFGRGGEEVHACRRAGVPVTVVPGVTSAIAVPAAAGIPVTHREISRAFTVASGHVPFSEDELANLAGSSGTLVVLMGVTTLPHLVAGLQRHGMRAETPLALVERGFSPEQRTVVTTVGGAVLAAHTAQVRSPAVIVIGDVVGVPSALPGD